MTKLLNEIKEELITFFSEILDAAPVIIIGIFVALLYWWISKIFRKKVIRYLKTKTEDTLQVNFISDIFKILNVIIGLLLFLYVIGKEGVVAKILGAGAISAFVIGFAFKDIGENFLAGIILAFKRPFRIGDIVMIQNIEGSIIDLNLRETHIKTFDGKDVYIPNGIIIKNPLFNYTMDGYLRQQFSLGFEYHADLELARRILLETINQIPGVLTEEKQSKTLIQDPEPYKISIITQYWINTIDSPYSGTEIKSIAIKSCMSALESNGIKITSHQLKIENAIKN